MNISKVAALAGVGKATVSRVLNNKKGVSKDTIAKVLSACEELNYTRNYFASNIMNPQTNIIGLFLEANNIKYYAYYNELLEGCITKASEYGMQILPYFAADAEKINLNLMPGRSPLIGAILLTPNTDEKRLLKLQQIKIPCVIVGKLSDGGQDYLSVDINNRKLVTEFLYHLKDNGHKKVAFINSMPNITITEDRDKAVQMFLKTNSDMEIVTRYCEDKEGLSVGIYKEIVAEEKHITAVIVSSDILANELYEYFMNKDISIGKNISLISLGGNCFAEKLRPRLTRGVQNYKKLGTESIDLLMARISEEKLFNHSFIDSDIIWGESVAKL